MRPISREGPTVKATDILISIAISQLIFSQVLVNKNFQRKIVNNFLTHNFFYHMFWVLKRTVSLSFEYPQHTFAGPRSAVGNVSGYRYVSDYRSRGREFDPGLVPYFRGD